MVKIPNNKPTKQQQTKTKLWKWSQNQNFEPKMNDRKSIFCQKMTKHTIPIRVILIDDQQNHNFLKATLLWAFFEAVSGPQKHHKSLPEPFGTPFSTPKPKVCPARSRFLSWFSTSESPSGPQNQGLPCKGGLPKPPKLAKMAKIDRFWTESWPKIRPPPFNFGLAAVWDVVLWPKLGLDFDPKGQKWLLKTMRPQIFNLGTEIWPKSSKINDFWW